MTLIISQYLILKVQERTSESEKLRTHLIKNETGTAFIAELELKDIEEMSNQEIRKELRKEYPTHNSAGLPYCYKIADPHQRLKTLFPDTSNGEKIKKQGRLDWDKLIAQKQQTKD